ncbi:SMI1/KNR4 family protein [Lentzea sp. NPDC005914]|uniref:SMI1/KNR4 family protein n=1 Tax=Lentzea sp. NPDC005914 TaxID=3154572 RepID=UPI003408D086
MQAEFAAVAHELAALAADAIASTRKPWEFLRLRATVCRGARESNNRMNHRLTSGPSEEHVRCRHPLALRTLPDVVLDMRIERDGTFEALLTDGIKQFTGYLPPSYTVVLQPRPRHLFEPYERTEVVGDGPLAHVETELGVQIPAEVHDLYRSGRTTLADQEIIPAGKILAIRQEMLEIEHWLYEEPRRWDRGESTSVSHPGVVQRVGFHPLWVPISHNPRYQGARCVDLAPGPNGRVGQLVDHGRLVADSVTDWIADPTPLEVDPYYNNVSMTVHDPTPAELEALPKDIRKLTVIAKNDVDLTTADLSELDQLTSVEVRGARVALPSLPHVRMLEVAEADVDVTRLPADLDYLVLNTEQWRRCDVRPAAARLVGEPSLARALDWAESLGAKLPREVVRGTADQAPPGTPAPVPDPPRTPAARSC